MPGTMKKYCFVVALAILIFAGKADAQSPSPTTETPPPAVEQIQPAATPYDANCLAPKLREDADLCEQRRMSRATEDAVYWSRIQTFLNTLGFIALLVSLAFAGWAARAAAQAAKEASVANRPWIDVEGKPERPLKRNGDMLETGIAITAKNVGRSPAINCDYNVKFGFVDQGTVQYESILRDFSESLRAQKNIKRTIFPDAETKQGFIARTSYASYEKASQLKPGQKTVPAYYLLGVRYESSPGVAHVTAKMMYGEIWLSDSIFETDVSWQSLALIASLAD